MILLSPKSGNGGGGSYGRLVAVGVYDTGEDSGVPFGLTMGTRSSQIAVSAGPVNVFWIASGVPVEMTIFADSTATISAHTNWQDEGGDHSAAFTDFVATYDADEEYWVVSFNVPEVYGTAEDNGSELQFTF